MAHYCQVVQGGGDPPAWDPRGKRVWRSLGPCIYLFLLISVRPRPQAHRGRTTAWTAWAANAEYERLRREQREPRSPSS